ncbi:MAG TPA: alpha-mannosidase [Chloroflexota bacterium]|nr:alpha-mannosidase [Chloroflexota bacterium]
MLLPRQSHAAASSSVLATASTSTVYAHYYPWYSSSPQFRHWNGGDSTRPDPQDNLATTSYPLLGPYDSRDVAVVLDQHMRWLFQANVDVLIVSWWGQASYEDSVVGGILSKAAQYGLRVCFQIEPYDGRTAASIIDDIAYLYSQYGHHPAFYRTTRPTLNGPSRDPRGMFFVYTPTDPSLAAAIKTMRGTPNDAIILVRTDDSKMYSDADVRTQIGWTGADGMYNYGFYGANTTYNVPLPWSPDYLLIYAVCPGFDNARASGVTNPVIISRNAGAAYDTTWIQLTSQRPEGVAIVSFNEWHEGTQIEPAVPYQYGAYTYPDYEGHYGLTGPAAASAYLSRTAYWVNRYKNLRTAASLYRVSLPIVQGG